MIKPYILDTEATDGAARIIASIAVNFSWQRAEQYENELFEAIDTLCLNPDRRPIHRFQNGIPVRKYVFQEKTIVLYSEREAFISIDVITDARTDW